jgi:hypothetical protein
MRQIHVVAAIVAAGLFAGCAGTPVNLGSKVAGPVPQGEGRVIASKACGFQLLLVIPIGVNDRLERAYQLLQGQAGGDFITNVQLKESWTYGLVGTLYCTSLQATAVRGNSA